MQIAGVYTDKARRGDAKEFAPDEKAPRAVKLALADKFLKEGFNATATNLTVENFSYQKKGDPLKNRYQNNRYEVGGTVRYFLRDQAKDCVLAEKTQNFQLTFEDTLDGNGLPEFKTVAFHLE